jgi:hypothetical protein
MWRKHAPRRADQPNDRRVVLGLHTLSDMHLYRATPRGNPAQAHGPAGIVLKTTRKEDSTDAMDPLGGSPPHQMPRLRRARPR